MGDILTPEPVKLFVGVLSAFPEAFEAIRPYLVEALGPVDLESDLYPFEATRYYEPTMGPDLQRKFFSFKELISPGGIARIKIITNTLERRFAKEGRYPSTRPINLDPGYLTPAKIVLASTKDYSHRIYLSDGIYGEVTLTFSHGEFRATPWTYPDFQSPTYHTFFHGLRDLYRVQLRSP
jgi:hypothetical protein